MRIENKDEYYLGIALAVAKRSTCLKRQYGAIIVKNDTVISTGYNGAPIGQPHCQTCTKKTGHKDIDEYYSCPAVHAEMNAIIAASKEEMNGATLYLACIKNNKELLEDIKPCEICKRLITNAKIKRVKTKSTEITLFTN